MFKVKHKVTGEVETVYDTQTKPTNVIKFLVYKANVFSDKKMWTWVHAAEYEPLAEVAEVADVQPGTVGGDLGWL